MRSDDITRMGLAAGALALALLASAPARATERVDLYDAKSRRTASAVIDAQSGRVDFYDRQSRHTGWGQMATSGRVERYRLDGTRQRPTALPPPIHAGGGHGQTR